MVLDDGQRLTAFIEAAEARGETRLPPEPVLASELGLTRGRLRTLLQRLEGEQRIWRHVGKGTFIGPRELAAPATAVDLTFSVDEIMDARAVLEPQLAAQAAIHARADDLAALDRCVADMAVAKSFLEWKRLDEKLHRLIAEAAHNDLLLLLHDTLKSQIRRALDGRIESVYGAEPGPKSDTDGQHRDCVEAIRLHDPLRAEKAMREHLRAVRESLFGFR